MVDPLTIAFMRAAAQAYLVDTVELGTMTIEHDRYGKETETFSGTSIAAQLSNPTATETKLLEPLRAEGYLGIETMILVVAQGTALTSHVRTSDNKIWRVVTVTTPQGLAAEQRAVITREVPRAQ